MQAFFALLATVIMFGLAFFQLLLAGGAPLGRFAWSGQHIILPIKLRVASALSIIVYLYAALVILQEADLVSFISDDITAQSIWPFTALFFWSAIMNYLSNSKLERYVMTPIAAELFISFLIVAI